MMPLASRAPTRRLIVLGSTGSIGVNTLEVVAHLRVTDHLHFDVVGLATGSRADVVCEQARKHGTGAIAVANGGDHSCLNAATARVFRGPDAALELIDAVAQPGDLIVGAMVGSAGIPAVLAAIERGCDIALANKETLVAAGAIVMPRVRAKGVNLLPIDSEHSAIFQCLASNLETSKRSNVKTRQVTEQPFDVLSVRRIVLTASGGPFRTWPADRLAAATVEEALKHPTWSMGPKVTIDSASLMNKALEIIEAHWLFGLPGERIEVIVHPQSIVHGMVEFADGSIIAQLSPPDMKMPIQYALTWPARCEGISKKLDWSQLGKLEFEPVDSDRFRAPALARRAIEAGGTSGAILNAANETAVQAFLDRRVPFGSIVETVQDACEAIEPRPVHTMQDVLAADAEARSFVHDRLSNVPAGVSR